MGQTRFRWWSLAIAVGVLLSPPAIGGQERWSTREEIEHFLLTAEIIDARQLDQGVTNPWRLTLSDGSGQHDAAFQSIDQRTSGIQSVGGKPELMFADSYHFNIAAYRLACLVGLCDVVPPTVERVWRGRRGSLSWWIENAFDERQRINEKRRPPQVASWVNQMHRMYLFGELVYDTDRNQTNVLYTEIAGDWKLWMIDFTRAFRPFGQIRSPQRLARFNRELVERLRSLDRDTVRDAMGPHLTLAELGALMDRRDRIIAIVDKLVAQRGERAVLY
jgi:hypothetical protein